MIRGGTAARIGIALLFAANGTGFGAWAASVASAKAALGLSDGALGITLLCMALGAMLAMPVAGWLGGKKLRWMLSGAGLLYAAMLLAPGLAGSGPALGASLLLLGMSSGALDVSMNARASRFEQGWHRPVMSSFHAAFSLGGLVGTGIVALIEASGGGVAAGLSAACLAVLLAVMAHAVLDGDPRLSEPVARAGRPGWPGRALLGIGALCLLAFMTEGAVADWAGVFLRDVAGFPGAASAAGYAAFSAAMVTARALGDRWVARFGPEMVLWAGALVAGAGIGLAVLVPWAGPLGFGLVGLGAANVAPILFSAGGRASAAASAGIATVATLGYGGMLLGPPLIGGLAELLGLRAALLALAVAMGSVALAAGRVEAA